MNSLIDQVTKMEKLLPVFILTPLLAFLVSLFIRKDREGVIAWCMSATAGVQVIFAVIYTIVWALQGHEVIAEKEIILYDSKNYQFFITLFFDHVTAVYLILSSLLTYMIARFSRIYMHKDADYKRYFNTMLLYYFGIQVIIFSGNFETLLIGWEILGLSSFLLIAYYRRRYLPVRNGFKVFSIYRMADMGILLSMWLLHHVFHQNVTFNQLRDHEFVAPVISEYYWTVLIVAIFIFIAASVKSAQFPFCSWLPRAMEGPTPSSSIFYGSIAVHIGVYLLIRTYPLWSELMEARILLVMLGVASTLITSAIAKVQFSIKAQIAWSSMSQIGLMFIEIALGLEVLALIHLSGNAFLRSYQLLNSPSVATYKLRDQFFNLVIPVRKNNGQLRKRLRKTFYVLALNEYYMDNVIYSIIWIPFKKIGSRLTFLSSGMGMITSIVLIVLSACYVNFWQFDTSDYHNYIANAFALMGLLLVVRAFALRTNPYVGWFLLLLNHLWIAIAVSFNDDFNWWETAYYLFGVSLAAIVGFIVLSFLSRKEKFDLNDYYGHSINYKWLSIAFLLSCLALIGFPISTTFLGEDLMISHIHKDQFFLITIISMNIMLASVSTMRIYARIFMGPNHLWNQTQANRFA